VVATAVGDLPAVVQHEQNGLLVPPDDAPALAAALVRLLADPDEADRLGQDGRRHAVGSASWEVVAERVEGVFRERLAERRARAVEATAEDPRS
jgi:glycosyltransferase involved in cell wall biosynthesis